MWRPNKITFLIIIINNIVNSVYNNYKPDDGLNLIYLIIKRSFSLWTSFVFSID